MSAGVDYLVTVCAECLMASCWHGEFMCQRAVDAGITHRRASELRALGREHPSHFSLEKLREVYGSSPPGGPVSEISAACDWPSDDCAGSVDCASCPLFLCESCAEMRPWCFGADDNCPDDCDDCWVPDEPGASP